MSGTHLKEEFLRRLGGTPELARLFAHLPEVYFFIKDAKSRFVMGNPLFVEQCGAAAERDIIGRNDFDFFPRDRAEHYVRDDTRVLRTGRAMINRVELAPRADAAPDLFITTKIPLHDRRGRVIGLAGIARDMNRVQGNYRPLSRLSTVLTYIDERFAEPLTVPALAGRAGMSVSQFERRFRAVFQVSPRQYLIQTRVQKARKMLTETDDTLAKIAQDCGFYDHSHFTRHFAKVVGMTPKAYRRNRLGPESGSGSAAALKPEVGPHQLPRTGQRRQ